MKVCTVQDKELAIFASFAVGLDLLEDRILDLFWIVLCCINKPINHTNRLLVVCWAPNVFRIRLEIHIASEWRFLFRSGNPTWISSRLWLICILIVPLDAELLLREEFNNTDTQWDLILLSIILVIFSSVNWFNGFLCGEQRYLFFEEESYIFVYSGGWMWEN